MRLRTLIAATAALALAPAAVAHADSLATAAPGARNLATGGGYAVWFAPTSSTTWQLVVRAPDGTVTTPAVRAFAGAQKASIGSDRFAAGGRRLLAVYGRDDGDVYAYDLRTGTEERVAGISSRAYRESSPAIQFGRRRSYAAAASGPASTTCRGAGAPRGGRRHPARARFQRLPRRVRPRQSSSSAGCPARARLVAVPHAPRGRAARRSPLPRDAGCSRRVLQAPAASAGRAARRGDTADQANRARRPARTALAFGGGDRAGTWTPTAEAVEAAVPVDRRAPRAPATSTCLACRRCGPPS